MEELNTLVPLFLQDDEFLDMMQFILRVDDPAEVAQHAVEIVAGAKHEIAEIFYFCFTPWVLDQSGKSHDARNGTAKVVRERVRELLQVAVLLQQLFIRANEVVGLFL